MSETATEAVELLTCDEHGDAIEGPKFPADLGVAKYLDGEDRYGDPRQRLAYQHTFFRYDENGQGMPETAVRFLVPSWMLSNGFPNKLALRAVEQRMGWSLR